MASDESTVMLKSPENWDAWNKRFKGEAMRRDILDIINGTKVFRTFPKMPEPKDFQTQVQTRSSSGGQTTSSQCDITYADLTEAGKSNIQFAFTVYKAEKELYVAEKEALDKLQTWMTKTVASNYIETCFDYDKDIKVWYNNLKQQVGLNEHTIKLELINAYKRAIRPLAKTPKDIKAWTAN